MTKILQSFIHDELNKISNEEIFLQDFLIILKRPLQNYSKSLKKYVFGTMWTDSITHWYVTRRGLITLSSYTQTKFVIIMWLVGKLIFSKF